MTSEPKKSRKTSTAEDAPPKIIDFPANDISEADVDAIENRYRKGFPFTEHQLTLRFAHRYCSDVRYCTQHESFYLYDGTRWVRDEKMVTEKRAGRMVTELIQECAREKDLDVRSTKLEAATKFQNQRTIKNIVQGVAKYVAVSATEFDSNNDLLNLENGTYNTATCEFHPHNPDDLITKKCRVEYQPDQAAPVWEKTIAWATGEDSEYIEYIRRFFVYCLTGDVQEEIFVIALGAGGNGKSKIFGTLQYLLKDYSVGVVAEALMQTSKADPKADGTVASLRGVRLAIASESQDGHQFNDALMKELTGRDPLHGRAQYEKFIDFDPTHKLILFTNHRPYVKDTSTGFWRRARLWPFNHTAREAGDPDFQPGDTIKDEHLDKKLEKEMPGILNWIFAGINDYHAQGVGKCAKVDEASKAYRAEMDVIGAFLADCAVVHKQLPKELHSTNKELFDEYKSWCLDTNRQAGNRGRFIERMREKGYQQYEDNHRAIHWRGVSIATAARNWEPPIENPSAPEAPAQTTFIPTIAANVSLLTCPQCHYGHQHAPTTTTNGVGVWICQSCGCHFADEATIIKPGFTKKGV